VTYGFVLDEQPTAERQGDVWAVQWGGKVLRFDQGDATVIDGVLYTRVGSGESVEIVAP